MSGAVGGPGEVGLARERTSLSWTRTALALVANGVLVLVRREGSFPVPLALTLSVLWVLLAGFTIWCAAYRRGVLHAAGDHLAPAGRFVVPLAVSVGLLCVVTAISILLT